MVSLSVSLSLSAVSCSHVEAARGEGAALDASARFEDTDDGVTYSTTLVRDAYILAPKGGRFSVRMPGPPVARHDRAVPPPFKRSVFWYHGPVFCASAGSASGIDCALASHYYAGYLEPLSGGDLAALVEDVTAVLAEQVQAKRSSLRVVEVGGNRGREVRLDGEEWTAVLRYFQAQGRLYQVMVLFPRGKEPGDAESFLSSLSIELPS